MIIRNVDDDVRVRLKKQAAEHGWSMEEEAYQILRNALKEKGIAPVHPMAFLFAGGRADSLEPGVPAGVVAVPAWGNFARERCRIALTWINND